MTNYLVVRKRQNDTQTHKGVHKRKVTTTDFGTLALTDDSGNHFGGGTREVATTRSQIS